jgi:uncharacterized damage-inducible protein DinB
VESIDLVRDNLTQSRDRVLARVAEMRGHALVFPTPNGGCHTLWVLGHLAYIESLIVRTFLLGEENPLADWESLFDGPDVSGDAALFPPFDEVLARLHATRDATLALLGTWSEADLDRPSAKGPAGHEHTFGTARRCLQYVADHTYMHRGHLADARRAAGLDRMWV